MGAAAGRRGISRTGRAGLASSCRGVLARASSSRRITTTSRPACRGSGPSNGLPRLSAFTPAASSAITTARGRATTRSAGGPTSSEATSAGSRQRVTRPERASPFNGTGATITTPSSGGTSPWWLGTGIAGCGISPSAYASLAPTKRRRSTSALVVVAPTSSG